MNYHETRLSQDDRRSHVWKALWRYYFSKQISADACVLDLGSGYGDFINHVVAKDRIAVDAWPDMPKHLASGVKGIVSSVTDLSAIADNSVHFAFASNLFEHLTQADFAKTLAQLRAKLTADGTLTILQPNYRYAYREYFDDYTHVAMYSHISLSDFLAAHGFEVLDVQPQFLPLTIKSRLPTWPILIWAYLKSPFKVMGKQMLLRARRLP